MQMNNADFIKKYGKIEFYDVCKNISYDLSIAKLKKEIDFYKINKKKKVVKFYNKNNKSICLEFATIYSIGFKNLRNYIERKGERKQNGRETSVRL